MVRTQTVRFSPTRSAMPKTVRIGHESDNLVERLEFVLPDIAAAWRWRRCSEVRAADA